MLTGRNEGELQNKKEERPLSADFDWEEIEEMRAAARKQIL